MGVPLNVLGVNFDQTLTPASGTSDIATFNLYVRNNVEDPGNSTSPVTDTDAIVNLISVGQVWASEGVDGAGVPIRGRLLATKILEEQIQLARVGQSASNQEGNEEGGTGTGLIGGTN